MRVKIYATFPSSYINHLRGKLELISSITQQLVTQIYCAVNLADIIMAVHCATAAPVFTSIYSFIHLLESVCSNSASPSRTLLF